MGRASEPAIAPRSARRRPRPRFVVALAVLAAIAGAFTSSIGAWRLLAGDHDKQQIAATLAAGAHIGRLAAAGGPWSLYVDPGAGGVVDWELSSSDESAAGRFLGRGALEISGAGRSVVFGRVDARRVASAAILTRSGAEIPVSLHAGYFLVALRPHGPVPVAVVTRDRAGRVVARAAVDW